MVKVRSKLLAPLLVALWLSVCAVGLCKLAIYEHTSAVGINGPAQWPSDIGLQRGSQYTFVLSIHPQCPCTRATLQELAILLTRCRNVHAYLLFIKPEGMSEAWVTSDLWSTCTSFPRCTLIVDERGKISSAFNAKTSGQSYLYDASGQLIYSGGITQSRGHAGDNEGLSSIIALIDKGKTNTKSAPVFGCSLFNERVVCNTRSRNP